MKKIAFIRKRNYRIWSKQKESTHLASLASSDARVAGKSVSGSGSAEYFWSVEKLQIFLQQKVAHLDM